MAERDYLIQLYAASLQRLLSGMTEAERNTLSTALIRRNNMTERDYLIQLYAASLQGLLSGMTEAERNMLSTAPILAWEIAQKAYGEQNNNP